MRRQADITALPPLPRRRAATKRTPTAASQRPRTASSLAASSPSAPFTSAVPSHQRKHHPYPAPPHPLPPPPAPSNPPSRRCTPTSAHAPTHASQPTPRTCKPKATPLGANTPPLYPHASPFRRAQKMSSQSSTPRERTACPSCPSQVAQRWRLIGMPHATMTKGRRFPASAFRLKGWQRY